MNLPIQRILGKDGFEGFPACHGEISRPLEQIARAEQGRHGAVSTVQEYQESNRGAPSGDLVALGFVDCPILFKLIL